MSRYLLLAAIVLLPKTASAFTFVQFLGLFDLFVGLFLTVTLMTFAAGVFVYIARLGTWPSYRDVAIKVLEWALVQMIVLVTLLGIVRYFQRYPKISVTVLAIVMIVVVAVVILRFSAKAPKKDEDH